MIGAISSRLFGAFLMTGLASQSVEFTQQYMQRLGGAADELKAIVERFDTDAAAQNLKRDAAIERLRDNSDPFVAGQGERMDETVRRAGTVLARYDSLRGAMPLLRPFILASDPDVDIARRTFDDFRPALPVTLDGAVLTFAGFVFGWAGGATGHGVIRMARHRTRRSKDGSASQPGGASGSNGEAGGAIGDRGDRPSRTQPASPLPKRLAGERREGDFL